MLNTSKIKKAVKTNIKPALYYTGGFVVGVACVAAHYKPQVKAMQLDAVNELLRACEKENLMVFAFTAAEAAERGLVPSTITSL